MADDVVSVLIIARGDASPGHVTLDTAETGADDGYVSHWRLGDDLLDDCSAGFNIIGERDLVGHDSAGQARPAGEQRWCRRPGVVG